MDVIATLPEDERHALLAAIVASSEDAIVSKTLAGIITSWNPAAERLFGYMEHEAIGQHISLIIPKDRLHEEEYIIGQVSSGKRVEHFETIRRTKSGDEIFISVTISPVVDREGRVIGASKIARDITSHRRLVMRLEESEQQSRAIVAAAPFPIGVYTGREMRIALANQSMMDVWGKGNEVTGKTFHELLPELEETEIFRQLDNVYTTGASFHARNQRIDLIVKGELRPFYFNYSFTPLRNAENEVYGVMNTGAEITDLVLAKQQLERSGENLRGMIIQAPVAMAILTGPDHVIEVANRLMVELWGKPEREVMNKPVFDALPDARGQGLEAVMKNVFDTGETFYANEMPVSLVRHGRPDIVYQNFVYQAYRNPEGVIVGVIAITIDVTEQVLARQKIEQSEAELQKIRKRLEEELAASQQLQRQKDDFIGMASHELKTPLTSLYALIQVAQAKSKKGSDPFFAQAMNKAAVQLKKMSVMINGFLNVSRLEAGKIDIEKTRFEITHLVTEVVDEIRLITAGHEVIIEKCAPQEIVADREKIGSVISNLVNNAIKYSPRGKRVTINCKVGSREITISVKDEGIGIKPEHLDHIFDRYYRVENAHTKHIASFGIGLYLSAEVIRQHDGNIWAESESGKGSAFYFTLPV